MLTSRISPTGSGESGKSTIVKQMKIIHQNGYTVDELAMYRHTIYKNVIDCAKTLVAAVRQFGIEMESENRVNCDFIANYAVDPDPHQTMDPDVAHAITAMWKDPGQAVVLEHANEFYLMDSAP